MLYPPGRNPAVALYDLWLMLLSAQGSLDKPRQWARDEYYARARYLPQISYGDFRTAIGVHSYDDQERPILCFGGWYGRGRPIYQYLLVRADGQFMLLWPWGDNHTRLEKNTFLSYGVRSGRYIWSVSTSHAVQPFDVDGWRVRQPYVLESTLSPRAAYYNPGSHPRWWTKLEQQDSGLWTFAADDESRNAGLQRDYKSAERRYELARRKHYKREGLPLPNLSVRSGKVTYKDAEAVQQIAAVLDWNAPATVRPKTAEEASV